MRCKHFIEQYSAYRDGLDPELKAVMEAHLETCPSCRAHDRAVRLGVDALRETRVRTSPGFEQSLQARLERGVEDAPDHPNLTALPATATVLLVLALLALALHREPTISTAAAEANPPEMARPRAQSGIPFVAFVPNP